MRLIIFSCGALVVTACARTPPAVEPSEMGAPQHEAEANKELQIARLNSADYDPKATARIEQCARPKTGQGRTGEGFDQCWTSVVNPTEDHLVAANQHRQHAAAHRAASKVLRDAEARACVGVDPMDRDTSPFEHPEDIARVAMVPRGALIVFRAVPTLTAEQLQKIVECHIARNAAVGHDMPEMPYCPLVPNDVTAWVEVTRQGLFEVTIRSDNDDSAREIQRRSQMLLNNR